MTVKYIVLPLLMASLLAVSYSGAAEFDGGEPLEDFSKEVKIERIVIDHALTFIGHEFYRAFAKGMADQGSAVNFDQLVVEERAYARSGSLISVEYKNRRVFQIVIYAGISKTEQLGKNAAAFVGRYLAQQQLTSMMFGDPDLARDEIE